jgi:hypothetical protein
MLSDAKPLVLKDELARLARHADPGAWLRDAHEAIEEWRGSMPNAQRAKLCSVLDANYLGLKADDGWGQNSAFARYGIDRAGVAFACAAEFEKADP